MRIVNAMFGRGLGGIEQALVDYCEALKLTGHEPHAIIHPRAAIAHVLKERGITFHMLPNRGAWDLWAAMRLKRLLKKIAPDASIAHGNRAICLLKRASAQTLIGVTHNYKIKCAGLAAIFCPTHDLMNFAKKQGVAENRIMLVPNMVRVPSALHLRLRHQPPVIGSMGRFVDKKGFDIFIRALGILFSQGVAFRAVLAGDGDREDALKTLAKTQGVGEVVHFTGWVEHKQAFFDSIDIFCLPSLHEPFGIVLLEAMAEGLPVVSTNSEGPAEILRNGHDGLIVEKGDALMLARALQSLLNDAEKARSLAEAAYETVHKGYNLPVVSTKLDLALRQATAL